MKTVLAIGLGSCIGGICRYLLTLLIQSRLRSAFPFGTLGVNIAGCFLIGLVFGLAANGAINQEWRLYLATGLVGGFTTFSAFSLETVGLLREGNVSYAILYIVASVALGLLATVAGMSLAKTF